MRGQGRGESARHAPKAAKKAREEASPGDTKNERETRILVARSCILCFFRRKKTATRALQSRVTGRQLALVNMPFVDAIRVPVAHAASELKRRFDCNRSLP